MHRILNHPRPVKTEIEPYGTEPWIQLFPEIAIETAAADTRGFLNLPDGDFLNRVTAHQRFHSLCDGEFVPFRLCHADPSKDS